MKTGGPSGRSSLIFLALLLFQQAVAAPVLENGGVEISSSYARAVVFAPVAPEPTTKKPDETDNFSLIDLEALNSGSRVEESEKAPTEEASNNLEVKDSESSESNQDSEVVIQTSSVSSSSSSESRVVVSEPLTTEKPDSEPAKPVSETEKPVNATESPISVTEKPVNETEELVSQTEKPEKPLETTQKPAEVPENTKEVSTEAPSLLEVTTEEAPEVTTFLSSPEEASSTAQNLLIDVQISPENPSSTGTPEKEKPEKAKSLEGPTEPSINVEVSNNVNRGVSTDNSAISTSTESLESSTEASGDSESVTLFPEDPMTTLDPLDEKVNYVDQEPSNTFLSPENQKVFNDLTTIVKELVESLLTTTPAETEETDEATVAPVTEEVSLKEVITTPESVPVVDEVSSTTDDLILVSEELTTEAQESTESTTRVPENLVLESREQDVVIESLEISTATQSTTSSSTSSSLAPELSTSGPKETSPEAEKTPSEPEKSSSESEKVSAVQDGTTPTTVEPLELSSTTPEVTLSTSVTPNVSASVQEVSSSAPNLEKSSETPEVTPSTAQSTSSSQELTSSTTQRSETEVPLPKEASKSEQTPSTNLPVVSTESTLQAGESPVPTTLRPLTTQDESPVPTTLRPRTTQDVSHLYKSSTVPVIVVNSPTTYEASTSSEAPSTSTTTTLAPSEAPSTSTTTTLAPSEAPSTSTTTTLAPSEAPSTSTTTTLAPSEAPSTSTTTTTPTPSEVPSTSTTTTTTTTSSETSSTSTETTSTPLETSSTSTTTTTTPAPTEARKEDNESAAKILEYVNPRVDPCEDFYEYACGNFGKDLDVAGYGGTIRAIDVLQEEINSKLEKVLKEPPSEKDIAPYTLAKRLYSLCSEKKGESKQRLDEILQSLGGWPILQGDSWNSNVSWPSFAKKFKDFGLATNFIVDLGVAPDLQNASQFVLKVKPTDTLLKDFQLNHLDIDLYRTYISAVLDSLGGAVKTQDIDDLIDFESHLVRLRSPKPYSSENYAMKNLDATFKFLDWFDFITSVLPYGTVINVNDDVIVDDPQHLLKLEALLSSTPARTKTNYVIWRFVEWAASFVSAELRSLHASFHHTKESCIDLTRQLMPEIASSIYAKQFLKEDHETQVMELFADFDVTADLALGYLSWIDTDTKTISSEYKILAPKKFRVAKELEETHISKVFNALRAYDPTLLGTVLKVKKFNNDRKLAYLKQPTEVDWAKFVDLVNVASYKPVNDRPIVIPATLIEGQLSSNDTRSIDYATVVAQFSRFFINRFLDIYPNGSYGLFWSNETRQTFDSYLPCIVDQYSNFSTQYGNVDGERSKLDNLVDLGTFRVAHVAFQILGDLDDRLLPRLKYSKPRQVFWTKAAQSFCTKYTPDALKTLIREGKTPAKYRVNGATINLLDFNKDFGCPVNPQVQRCTEVWAE